MRFSIETLALNREFYDKARHERMSPDRALDLGWDAESADVGEFPFELTSEELASACRRAYMHLVNGAYAGWGKVELARWLTGPYHRLTVRDDAATSGPFIAARFVSSPSSPSVNSDASNVADDRVTKLLEDMRTDALLVLRELMAPEGLSAFTTLAFDTGLVTREAGIILPHARARMGLVDRVLSLVAVDALTRPEDFEHSLFVCERCHRPVFDVASRPFSVCRVHVSGVNRK
jgi:hypothetical protein